jgi:hypothetical protein
MPHSIPASFCQLGFGDSPPIWNYNMHILKIDMKWELWRNLILVLVCLRAICAILSIYNITNSKLLLGIM